MLCSGNVAGSDWLSSPLLLDGAMGTALIARGLDLAQAPPDLWSIERPEEVRAVHNRYIEAGCGALTTNSFGANGARLARYGLAAQVDAINLAAASAARDCAPAGVRVLGSIGPSGAVPPPEGDANLHELEDLFAEQAAALAAGKVDALLIETFYHPKELRAALRGCRAGAPDLPVIASFACKRVGSDGFATSMGFAVEAMVGVALEESADSLGINCALLPDDMVPLIRRLAERTQRPLLAQPIISSMTGPPLFPEEFAAGVAALFEAGARLVGGCCGTSPTDLAAAHDALALDR